VSRPVRIALLDDHPAVLEGLEATIAAEPDLEVVGTAASEGQLWPLVLRERPDVVVLDLHHRGRDGLALCFEITRWPHAPAIGLYTALVDNALVVAAALAGAGAVISKSTDAATLLETIRELARSPRALPNISLRTRRELAARLDPSDRAIVAMRLAGDHPAKIAHTLGLSPSKVTVRIANMIARLEQVREAA
jgi:DNA-binding NarL/FixJ family response regulator